MRKQHVAWLLCLCVFGCNATGGTVGPIGDGGTGPRLDGGASAVDGGQAGADGGEDGGAVDGGGTSADGGPDGGELDAGCENGDVAFCGSKVGVCHYGQSLCQNGVFGPCVGGVQPSPEICDGLDNDCNGFVDDRDPPCECMDGQTQECGTSDVGECRFGTQTCVDGTWGACVGSVEPTARECDDLDRDCNGAPDWQQLPCLCRNDDTEPCGSSTGVCRPGTRTCTDGIWGGCLGGSGPATTNPNEGTAGLCNGLDDNCDGNVDEGCGCVPPATQPCGITRGDCVAGTQTCQLGGTWGPCAGTYVGPSARQCDNHDRDCDGTLDWQQAPCNCRNGDSRSCGITRGTCVAGTQSCVSGQWGACGGTYVGPQPEICDGLDNDCDGTLDNGLRAPTAVACWVNPGGQLVCADPNTAVVPPLATVQLDGRQSSDPDGQTLSYSWRIASAPSGSTSTITNPQSARPAFFVPLSGDYRVCLTVTDTTGCRSTEACVTIHVISGAAIHVELFWDKNTDVDLHFMQSSINNFFDYGGGSISRPHCAQAKDCFFLCRAPSWGAGGTADDPTLDIDDVDGDGPENISMASAANLRYVIAVHYFCDRTGPDYNSSDHLGPTTATVNLYFFGGVPGPSGVRPNFTWSRQLNSAERWYVADIDWTNANTPQWVVTTRNQVAPSLNFCPP